MQHRGDGAFDEQLFVAEHQMQSRCRAHPTIVPWPADAAYEHARPVYIPA
jgi:hypothetical protein